MATDGNINIKNELVQIKAAKWDVFWAPEHLKILETRLGRVPAEGRGK